MAEQQWQGKSRGNLLGHKIFVFTIKNLGLRVAYFFLIFVAFWFSIFSREGAKAQYYLFRNKFKYNKLKALFSVYKNHYKFGQILIDKIAVLSGLKDKFKLEHTNYQVIENMIKDKTGGILVNAHIGSWEIAGQLLERYGGKIHVVMLDVEHNEIKQYLSKVTGEKPIEIIAIQEDGSHMKRIKEVLENKEIIAMHGDRFTEGVSTVEHDFLGEKALFPSGPFHLAAKFGVPFTFATAFKEGYNKYHFYAMLPQYVEYPGNLKKRKEAIYNSSKLYISNLEEMLKKYPTQWFNYYDFWKKS